MDWNTVIACWFVVVTFISLVDMRWEHVKDWRFVPYFILNYIIMIFGWPFFVIKWINHYKQTVPTRLYETQGN